MTKKIDEDTFFKRYKKLLEGLYKHSRIYRDLVYFSKLVRMFVYIATGISILVLVFFGQPMTTLEDLISWMSRTIPGRIIALLVALSLIIYGLEKPR